MRYKLFLMILLPVVFVGCSKTTVVLLDSGKSENSILVANEKAKTKLDKVGSYVDVTDKEISTVKKMSKNEIASRFAKVLAITPFKPIRYILYFKPNFTELTEASHGTFKKALDSIKERSPCSVDIIGHTDTVGSSAMNIKISLKRAKSIQELIKQTKVETLALVAKGYGEEDLLVQTKNNIAEAKNRNVEIFIK